MVDGCSLSGSATALCDKAGVAGAVTDDISGGEVDGKESSACAAPVIVASSVNAISVLRRDDTEDIGRVRRKTNSP